MREFVLVVCWMGVIQAVLLSGYFLSTINKNYNRLFLGLALLLSGMRAAKSTLFIFNDAVSIIIINIGFAAHAIIGPLLLLYVKSLTKNYVWSQTQWLHFIPGFLILCLSPFLRLDSFWYRGGYITLLLYTLAYIIFYSVRFVKFYRDERDEQQVSSRWVAFLLLAFTLFLLAYFSNYILQVTSYTAAPIIYSLLILCISFLAIWNNGLFTYQQKKRYQHLNLSQEILKTYSDNIIRVMEGGRLYLDPNVTLQRLADQSGVPMYALSFVFSEQLKLNFTQFINSYRIEEANRLLLDPAKSHITIAGIAYECGFNTLSSFNSAFKKVNQVTPSEYRKTNSASMK